MFRAILNLCRLPALPTVWSNCLAGWWLGGGGHYWLLPLLLIGNSFLYLGASLLKDAFDADYDRQHNPSRPIPSGAVTHDIAWRWGLGLLVTGALSLLCISMLAAALALALISTIILHHAAHRHITFAPMLLGFCRFFLYVIGAAVAERGITGWALWCGIALALYVTGSSWLARWQHTPALTPYWPAALLTAPFLLSLLMNTGRFRQPGLLLALVAALWVIRCLRPTYWSQPPNLKNTTSGLQAGIVLIDWLAACPVTLLSSEPHAVSYIFIGLFVAAVLFQRLLRPAPSQS